jgi:hypothetical protein
MAFDGTHFYLMGSKDSETLELVRVNSEGSDLVSVATMPSARGDAPVVTGGSLALDESCVYWSNGLGIFSLAKTAETPLAQ